MKIVIIFTDLRPKFFQVPPVSNRTILIHSKIGPNPQFSAVMQPCRSDEVIYLKLVWSIWWGCPKNDCQVMTVVSACQGCLRSHSLEAEPVVCRTRGPGFNSSCFQNYFSFLSNRENWEPAYLRLIGDSAKWLTNITLDVLPVPITGLNKLLHKNQHGICQIKKS